MLVEKEEGTSKKIESLIDPFQLFSYEVKDKNWKKQAIQQIKTISLALGCKRTCEELLPFVMSLFMQQNLQIRKTILKAIPSLFTVAGNKNIAIKVLEILLDVLCVFSEEQIRLEAYVGLQKTVEFIDFAQYQTLIIETIVELSKQEDKNIKEVALKMISLISPLLKHDKFLILWNIYQEFFKVAENNILIAKQLSFFIKSIPQSLESEIFNIVGVLIASQNSKIRSNMIDSVIQIAKCIAEDKALIFFGRLCEDANSDVVKSIILKINLIKEVFSIANLQPILKRIDNFQNQDNQIKNSVIQVIEHIPIRQERKRLILNAPQNSLNLQKTLANTLCRIQDTQALLNLIKNSDNEFKIKIFPKITSFSQIHSELFQNIFAQKNWRGKITILQNIEKRIQNNEKVELLLPKLFKQLGDKIAIIRSTIVKIIANIVIVRQIQLKTYKETIQEILLSKNWFQRQSIFILLLLIVSSESFQRTQLPFIEEIIKNKRDQKIINIKSVIEDIASKIQIIKTIQND